MEIMQNRTIDLKSQTVDCIENELTKVCNKEVKLILICFVGPRVSVIFPYYRRGFIENIWAFCGEQGNCPYYRVVRIREESVRRGWTVL